jgi:hypothetical protein
MTSLSSEPWRTAGCGRLVAHEANAIAFTMDISNVPIPVHMMCASYPFPPEMKIEKWLLTHPANIFVCADGICQVRQVVAPPNEHL